MTVEELELLGELSEIDVETLDDDIIAELLDKALEITDDDPYTEDRWGIIENIATYVGRMHGAGLAHQDLYLVHFFLRGEEMVPHLIDLQRVIKEKTLSDRWRIKDLGELLFSARELVSDEDISHFCRIYSRVSGFNLMDKPRVIKAIEKKAAKIKARHERKHSGHQEKN